MENASETEVTDDGQSFLAMELEALKSIYVNEINFGEDLESTTVSIDLFPATADKLDEQYVRMTLHFLLSSEYPEEIPKIQIRNPRGLSEEKVECITKEMMIIAESNKGNSMLFEMIEAAKEHLTTGNRPCEECAICLYGFSENDVFTKTECYHYFHSHCLARYAKNFKENENEEDDPKSKRANCELLCPMCRVPTHFSGNEEDYPPPEASDDSKFELTEEMVELQEEMAQLFQKQVEKGGIIDLEAEKNKFLLEISNVSTRDNIVDKQDSKTSKSEIVEAQNNVPVVKAESSEQVSSPAEEKIHRSPNKETDARKKYSNYKQQNEARRNYDRPDRKFSRPYNNDSFDRQDRKFNRPYNNDSRRNYSGGRSNNYSNKYNRKRYPHDEAVPEKSSEDVESEKKTIAEDADLKSEAVNVTPTNNDDADVVKNDQRRENWYRPRFSPRRYKGLRRGNYHNYEGSTRTDRQGYLRKQNSNESDKDTAPIEEKGSEVSDHQKGKSPRRGNYNNYEGSTRTERHGYLRKQNSNESDKDVTPIEEKGSEVSDHQKERAPYQGNRRNGYRNNRPNFDQDQERGSYNWNPQRGNRRGYNRPNNYYNNDSKPFVKDRYWNPAPNQSYEERNRNFHERESYQGNRRGNYSDSYKPQSNRGSGRNNPTRYAENRSLKPEDTETCSTQKSPQVNSNSVTIENEVQGASGSNSHEKSSTSESHVKSEKNIPCFTEAHEKSLAKNGVANPAIMESLGSLRTGVNPPPGFANPLKKVVYGKPPPGFSRS